MKKFLILGLISLAVSLSACKSKEEKNKEERNDSLKITTIKFDEPVFSFGTITSGEVVEHVFNFTNTGKFDLKIQDVQASCGCTTPDYTKEVVKPGQKGQIQVKFNSKNREGKQSKHVTVYANTDPDATVLQFTAEVKPQK